MNNVALNTVPDETLGTLEAQWWREAEYIASLYQPPPVGRPGILTDVPRVAKYLVQLAAGNYQETAARLAGITKQSLYEWRKQADDSKHPNRNALTAFVNAEKRAEAEAESAEVVKVRNAANDPRFWAAGMTFLERRHPERWARRSEDSNAPKVIVQIGVKDSDVQVTVNEEKAFRPSPFAPLALDQGAVSD